MSATPVAPSVHREDLSGRAELFEALGAATAPPGAGTGALFGALGLGPAPAPEAHAAAFVTECHPYASFHLSAEGTLGGEPAGAVGGFWRVLGLEPPSPPDHLGALLSLYASLLAAEAGGSPPGGTGPAGDPARAAAIARRARATLLWEHVVSWAPGYLDSVARAVPAYRPFAALATEVLLGEAAATPPPGDGTSFVAAALRDPPGGLEGEGDVVDLLSAPLRCGMVLTPADLGRAARELDLGLRVGGRRFLLGSLLDQDPARFLGWLAREATQWEAVHTSRIPALGSLGRFWAERAATSAHFLERAAALPARPAG